jgi:hypothetical protein
MVDDGLADGYPGRIPVPRGAEEPNRPPGMLRRDIGPDGRQGEESRRVLGVRVDWYGPVDEVWLRSLRHPIKAYKRWTLIRRLGPYAPDEDDPNSTG